jgi:hypothetical protein
MNPQSEEELQRRLKELEKEVQSKEVRSPFQGFIEPESIKPLRELNFTSIKLQLERFMVWYKNLSDKKRLIVLVGGGIFALGLLQALVKLVTGIISLAILAVLLYVGYKFFVSKKLPRQ